MLDERIPKRISLSPRRRSLQPSEPKDESALHRSTETVSDAGQDSYCEQGVFSRYLFNFLWPCRDDKKGHS